METYQTSSLNEINEKQMKLEQVVRVLRELPKNKKFNLNSWGHCGSVACACGWAGLDPWFRKQDFLAEKGPNDALNIYYDGWSSWNAVEHFFQLHANEMYYLFDSEKYVRGNKQDVISRITAFCRKLEKQKENLNDNNNN